MPSIPRNKKLLIGSAIAAVAAIIGIISNKSSHELSQMPMVPVQQGPIQVSALQGGEIRALKNVEVKCEIETPTKILSLIPEGYQITEKDIKEGKILIELDSAELRDRIVNHEIEFQNALTAYIEADEQRSIQTSDNQNIALTAQQAMRFALMDFERYIGKEVAEKVLRLRQLPTSIEALDIWAFEQNQKSEKRVAQIKSKGELEKEPAAEYGQNDLDEKPRIDFISYLEKDELGDGAAQQTLRKLSNDLLIQESEFSIARQNIEASERLAERKFITKTTLESDHVNHEKSRLAMQTGQTSLDLFKTYEFPKQAELSLSQFEESLKNFQRALRANRSRMTQVESRYMTAKRRYEVSLQRKEDLDRQLEATVIRATVPGLVAYGATTGNSGFRSNDVIEEGATVRFRQTLLTIPNMTQMGVAVNIHESQVKKVHIGQRCLVTVDAEPGKTLEGTVAELAVLPDSASSRFSPNLKVYPSVVHIKGTHEWMKPGMNAKVEIIIEQLDDVLYVPVQSIEVENDNYFTYVNQGGGIQRRQITTGSFNDQFIQIVDGLDLGEKVSLAIPKRQLSDMTSSYIKPNTPGEATTAQKTEPNLGNVEKVASVIK